MTTDSFQRILETLERHGVEYVVVGGVAAVLHGAPLTTFDIDALVKVDRSNSERLLAALTALRARFRENRALEPTLAHTEAGGHMLLLTDSGPLDVLGFIGGGKKYEDVVGTTDIMRVGNLSIRVLSLEGLIDDKRALLRDKDRAAISLLEAVLAKRSERR